MQQCLKTFFFIASQIVPPKVRGIQNNKPPYRRIMSTGTKIAQTPILSTSTNGQKRAILAMLMQYLVLIGVKEVDDSPAVARVV